MSITIKIDKITLENINVSTRELELFEDAEWTLELFKEFINDHYAYFFKAYYDNEFAGYCGMYHNTMNERHFCKIMDLEVIPAFRRKGIGKALMLTVIGLAKELGLDSVKLEVDTKNNEALELYKSLNFKIEKTEEGFYDDGGDAYIMWLYENN